MNSTLLQKRSRVRFDINDPEHLAQARYFFKNLRWERQGCPFREEFPFQSVPDLIRSRIVDRFLKLDQAVDQ